MWWWSSWSWTSWDYFWVRPIETRGITAVVLTIQKLKCWHAFGRLWIIWFKLGMMIDAIDLYFLDTSLIDVGLDSRSQECEKADFSFISHLLSAGDPTEAWGDGVCAGWMVACGHQPGWHCGSHTELLQCHQLPHRLAQDCAWPSQAFPQMDQNFESECCLFYHFTKLSTYEFLTDLFDAVLAKTHGH